MKKLYRIKKSNIDKRGLCAASNIKKGTKIIEYKGKIISVKKAEMDPKFNNDKAIYLFNLNKKYDLDGNEISNMIITGHPGTGKTSTIKCLAKDIFKEDYKECVIELNASDNRGLETINNSIIHFCRKKVSTKYNIPKLIILDEADNITKKAQNTLTNLMERYNSTTKFAFTCNDYNKLV